MTLLKNTRSAALSLGLVLSLLNSLGNGAAEATPPAPAAPAGAQQTAQQAAVSPAMQQAFRLGYDIYLPIAQMQYLSHQVLLINNTTSDAEQKQSIADLDKLAARSRLVEQLSTQQTADLMRKMGVPDTIRAPYVRAAAEFAEPLPIASDAKGLAKSDPESARVLSTMEEADQFIPSDSTALASWLKIARGNDTDWAFHVGALEASLAVASDNDAPAIALLPTIPPLVAKAPASAPAGAKDAIMDLAHEIEQKQDITQAMLADAARALHRAFEGD